MAMSKKKKLPNRSFRSKKYCKSKMLPDLDSNQDIQDQNLLYYPYTIRQKELFIFGLQK